MIGFRPCVAAMFVFASLVALSSPAFAQSTPSETTLHSLDDNVAVKVFIDREHTLSYQILYKNRVVVAPSHLGVVTTDTTFGVGAAIQGVQTSEGDTTLPVLGNQSGTRNRYREATIRLDQAGTSFELIVRAYEDGVAFRYRVPKKKKWTITGELTEFALTGKGRAWEQGVGGIYESGYRMAFLPSLPAGHKSFTPFTVSYDSGSYLSIGEAALDHYSGMTLVSGENARLRADFISEKSWLQDGELQTPWRWVMLASDLNTLFNNTMVKRLVPSPDPQFFPQDVQTTWIQPGKSTWSWLGDSKRSTWRLEYDTQKEYIVLSHLLGMQYYLIDDGWAYWNAPGKDAWQMLRELNEFAKTQNIKLWIWADSNKGLYETDTRREYLRKCKEAGVVGLKIDFMNTETQFINDWYEDMLHDAAQAQILVNFHGANKPTGESRTWPNELAREGVRGLEQGDYDWGRHDTIVPFTRLLAGHADYTPVHFGAKGGNTTGVHQAASGIVFSAPFLCFADHPANLLTHPTATLFREMPSVYDETIVLPGSRIGEIAGFAKRSGERWFVAILNGMKPADLNVALSFLSKGKIYHALTFADDAKQAQGVAVVSRRVTSTDKLPVKMQVEGGYAAILSPAPIPLLKLTAEQQALVQEVMTKRYPGVLAQTERELNERRTRFTKERADDAILASLAPVLPKSLRDGRVKTNDGRDVVTREVIARACGFAPDEKLLAAHFEADQSCQLFVFTNYGMYQMSGKVYAVAAGDVALFDYMRGTWTSLNYVPYSQFKKMGGWRDGDTYVYTVNDNNIWVDPHSPVKPVFFHLSPQFQNRRQ